MCRHKSRMLPVNDVTQSTAVIAALLAAIFAVTLVVRRRSQIFPASVSQELKGFAIIAILFAHTGYYLVNNNQFLQPLSYLAGVGVDLFLFVSGFGLTMSMLKKTLPVLQFYRTRLLKLFIPLWIILIVFYLLDTIFLKLNYDLPYILRSFGGIFLHADLYADVNSPLWYFSFILFYYLIFPLLFIKRRPWISALAVYALSFAILMLNPPVLGDTIGLYEVHLVAFPLGMLAAAILSQPLAEVWKDRLLGIVRTNVWLKLIYAAVMAVLIVIAAHFAVYSGVGKGWYIEEAINILIVLAIVLLFILKPWQSNLLYAFGIYSYEIYLLQWPLGYRYGAFATGVPGWLAMLIYILIVFAACWALRQLTTIVESRLVKLKAG